MNPISHSYKWSALHFTLLSYLLIMVGSSLNAQEKYDIDYTVDYINKYIGENCELIADKKDIRIEFSRNGSVVRVDDFFPVSIDIKNGLTYSEGENSIIIKCHENAGDCIDKEIVIRKTKSFNPRTNMPVQCNDQECEAVIRAFRHLIMLYIGDEDYIRTKPFEEE